MFPKCRVGIRTVPSGASFTPSTPGAGWIVESETFRASFGIDEVPLGRIVGPRASGTNVAGSREAVAVHDGFATRTPGAIGFEENLLGTEWAGDTG